MKFAGRIGDCLGVVGIFHAERMVLSICVAVIVLVSASLLGCESPRPRKSLTRAFFFWKREFRLTTTEHDAFASVRADAIYLKLFDVAWDPAHSAAIPIAMLRFDSASIPRESIIPVVFLTEESLAKTNLNDIRPLAAHVADGILRMAREMGKPLTEVQFDCDWTTRTRQKYFSFIAEARAALPSGLIISSTIRLHQVKYRERTGVPPVDRGMLMYYNMANWRDVATKNSIFDESEAAKYIDYVHDYPLPLDLALPIFRWSLVYRNGVFLTILNGIDASSLGKQPLLQIDSRGLYHMLKDAPLFGASLRQGDIIRAEECQPDPLKRGAAEVLHRIRNKEVRIALYHLDSASLSHYTHATLDSLFME